MSYKANIPQPTDRISVSQNDLLHNFAALNTIFGFNHVTWDSVTNNGKHTVVSLQRQTVAPTVGAYPGNPIDGTDGAVYGFNFSVTNRSELYYKNASTETAYPISAGSRLTSGWAFIGGATVMAWGSSSGSGDVVIIPAPATYPAFTNIFSAQVTTFMVTSPNNVLARLKSIDPTGITVFCSNLSGTAANTSFQWMIIGATTLV